MKKRGIARTTVKVVGLLTALGIGTGQASTGGCTAEGDGEAVGAIAGAGGFGRYDINEDGLLSGNEVEMCACEERDADGDGRVTAAEFAAARTAAAGAREEGASGDADPAEAVGMDPSASTASAEGGPPLGKYVCRQYLTTIGYLTLRQGGVYEMSGVEGRYRFVSDTGRMEWQGGSFDDWDWAGTYEHVARPSDDGRPDEDIIRLLSEADGLQVNCYKMSES